jgi:hypothetical protein
MDTFFHKLHLPEAETKGPRRMIPARYAPLLFGLILSGLMSCMVSGIATFRALGLENGFFGSWMSSWSYSWAVAFPAVLIVAPITRRLVAKLIRAEG